MAPTQALIDRANLLQLTVPEMTALVGGLRALEATTRRDRAWSADGAGGRSVPDFFTNTCPWRAGVEGLLGKASMKASIAPPVR